MAEARLRAEWAQTSAQLATTVQCHCDPKKARQVKAVDFDPFARRDRKRKQTAGPKVGVSVLKDVFIDGKFPKEAMP